MADPNYVSEYFKNKAIRWRNAAGSVENYVTQKGKGGLILEFKNDPAFGQVCAFINEVAKQQYGPDIYTSLENIANSLIGVPVSGILDIIVGAAVEACNNPVLGADLIEKGLIAIVIFAIGAVLLAAIFSK